MADGLVVVRDARRATRERVVRRIRPCPRVDDPASVHRYYRYDVGRLVAYEAPEGTTTYAYDAAGRLSLLTRPDGSAIETTYAADGRVLTLSVRPVGAAISTAPCSRRCA